MLQTNYTLEDELRLSPKLVAAALVVFGIAFTFANEIITSSLTWADVQIFGGATFMVSLVIWLLTRWYTQISRWAAVAGVIFIIILGIIWLEKTEYFVFMSLPVALAAVILNLWAAGITALLETGLLLLLAWLQIIDAGANLVTIVIIAIWIMLGIMVAIYQPRYQMNSWFGEYFQRMQQALEEDRNRKVELSQTLDDLALANKQLVLLNDRLELMRLVAEEAQKAKTTFVAKVSHELRTPLNIIIGLVDVLIETPNVYQQGSKAMLMEDLMAIQHNCDHLTGMIDDVLDLSQAESGFLPLQREWVDLRQEIKQALTIVTPVIKKKGLGLRVNIPRTLPQVYCDRTRIRQVVFNLLSNAARYTDKGHIIFKAAKEGRHLIVSVRDTGQGISKEDQQNIFEPFYQAKEGFWQNKGGSGLGLSISKQFIDRHEGKIWVESEPNQGSTFTFSLPISPVSPLSAGPEQWVGENWVWTERTSWPNLPAISNKPGLIICDKTNHLYSIMARYADNIELINSPNFLPLPQELKTYPANAILINMEQPNQLVQTLSQLTQDVPNTPIIGCMIPPPVDRAINMGAVTHLIKPVTRVKLQATLKTISRPIKRILIVDDMSDLQNLLTRMVHTINNTFEVSIASTGQEALAKLHQNQPDLMLLDIVLPDMEGWEVLRRKAQDEAIKDIPVIIISAQDSFEQSTHSNMVLVSMGRGISVKQMLHASLNLSTLLQQPDSKLDLKLQ